MGVVLSAPHTEAPVSEFAGKTVLVTGAASGIGAAIATAFAAEGARLLVADRDGDAAAKLAAELGGAARALPVDVADGASVTALVADLEAADIEPDILVNNAGINLRGGIARDEAEDDWDRILAVNVTGAYWLTRRLLPVLAQRGGVVINLASIQSFIAFPNSIAYTASKGAVAQMTKAMAVEFAPLGVRVNAVAPGFVATKMTEPTRADAARLETLHRRIPLGRFATPDEIADPVLFLASRKARYMTGAIVPVDGGFLAT